MRSAVCLAPGSAGYRWRLASLLDFSGEEAISSLRAAVALAPYHADAWIQLGLAAEARGDFPEAERCLLRAAAVDRRFQPRWVLCDYYFRRQAPDPFWTWARAALQTEYPDGDPVFRLAWRVNPDPDAFLARAANGRKRVLTHYLSFLLREAPDAEAGSAARALLSQAGPAELPVLLDYCEREIERGRPASALEVWNGLCRRKLLPYPDLRPGDGMSLTNADFAEAPLAKGFDWRLSGAEGLSFAREKSLLRVEFSGRQADDQEILSQVVPVLPSRRYRFLYRYQTEGLEPQNGIHWRIAAPGANARSPYLMSANARTGALQFEVPHDCRAIRLALRSERVPGHVRPEGWLRLADLDFRLEGATQ